MHMILRSKAKWLGLAGAFWAFWAVILGAFGAHGLKESMEAAGGTATWETAVDYHFRHALALLALACLRGVQLIPGRTALLAGACFETGIILFSGSLYWLALDGPGWLGPVTPLGGFSFLAGWILIGLGLLRNRQIDQESVLPHPSP